MRELPTDQDTTTLQPKARTDRAEDRVFEAMVDGSRAGAGHEGWPRRPSNPRSRLVIRQNSISARVTV
jgi:hypothetical protein